MGGGAPNDICLSPKVRKCSSLCTYGEHVEIFKIFKNEKCAHRRCTDWSMCEKKCDTWAKDREVQLTLTLSIPTMLILMSNFLCVVRIASWRQGIKKITITQNFRHQGDSRTWNSHPLFSFSLRNPNLRSFGKKSW